MLPYFLMEILPTFLLLPFLSLLLSFYLTFFSFFLISIHVSFSYYFPLRLILLKFYSNLIRLHYLPSIISPNLASHLLVLIKLLTRDQYGCSERHYCSKNSERVEGIEQIVRSMLDAFVFSSDSASVGVGREEMN